MLEVGTIIFKYDRGKVRPFVCIHMYTNNAGVIYDYLIAPITSSNKLGNDNLIRIDHEILKKSYVKINNIQTISEDSLDGIKISKFKLDKENVRCVIIKIIKTLKKW